MNIGRRSNPGKRVIKRKRAYSPDNCKSTLKNLSSAKRSKRQSLCSKSKYAKRQKTCLNVKPGNVRDSNKLSNVFHNVTEKKSSTCSRRSTRSQINDHCKLENKQDREHCQHQPSKSEETTQENKEQAYNKQGKVCVVSIHSMTNKCIRVERVYPTIL